MIFRGAQHLRKFVIGLFLVAGIAVLFVVLSPYLSLEYLETQRANYQAYYARQPVLVFVIFVICMATLIGLSLPANGITLLLSGVLFGFPLGALAGLPAPWARRWRFSGPATCFAGSSRIATVCNSRWSIGAWNGKAGSMFLVCG